MKNNILDQTKLLEKVSSKTSYLKGLLSISIIVAVVIASGAIIVSAVFLVIEQNEDAQKLNQAKNIMTNLDTIVRELVYEATGARRSVDINTEDMILHVSRDSIQMEIEEDLLDPTTDVKEGNLIIKKSPLMSVYETDIDDNGDRDYVLANERMTFAVKKISSPGSLSGSITLMKNMITNTTMYPDVHVSVDGTNILSGQGYTEAVAETRRKGHITIYNTDLGYKAVFSLSAGNDFLELEIDEI